MERLDYRHGLSQQFPAGGHRVVYTASGMYMAAAVVSDLPTVIEHKLYWGQMTSLDEARFLTAILNSTVLTTAVRPLQGPRRTQPPRFRQICVPATDPTVRPP